MSKKWLARQLAKNDKTLIGFWPLQDNLLDYSGLGHHAQLREITPSLAYPKSISTNNRKGVVFGPFTPAITVPDVPVHIQDSFTGPNGALLSTHSPEINTTGNPWIERMNAIQIISNHAAPINTVNYNISTIETGAPNVLIFCTVSISSGNAQPGIVFRYLDNSNYWIGTLKKQGGSGFIGIYQVTSGSNPVLRANSANFTVTTGTAYTIWVILNGSAIQMFISGYNCSTTNTIGMNNTQHGLWGASNKITFEDFRVLEVL